jgi:hypothetical protein
VIPPWARSEAEIGVPEGADMRFLPRVNPSTPATTHALDPVRTRSGAASFGTNERIVAVRPHAGFDLLPRVKNIGSARLYRPAAGEDEQWPCRAPVLSTKTIDRRIMPGGPGRAGCRGPGKIRREGLLMAAYLRTNLTMRHLAPLSGPPAPVCRVV